MTANKQPSTKRRWSTLTAAATLLVLTTAGCGSSDTNDDATDDAATSQATPAATEVAKPSTVGEAITDGAEIIDVRTPEEFDTGHLRDAANIDVNAADFGDRISDLDQSATYVVYCASGNRAGTAITQMREQGFDNLINGGGYEDLAATGIPTT